MAMLELKEDEIHAGTVMKWMRLHKMLFPSLKMLCYRIHTVFAFTNSSIPILDNSRP